jgi:uncharacterized protein YfbU (UPF0304 family)
MELTKKDRLILMNQYQILKRLDPDSAKQYDQAIEILKHGYAPLYSQLGAGLTESELCEEKAQLVTDILGACQALEAYRSAHPEDKEVGGHAWAKFRGFDATTEAEYQNYARLLRQDTPASEAPTVAKYRMIASVWAAQGRPAEICRDIAAAMLGLGSPAGAEAEPEAAGEESAAAETSASEATAAPSRSRKRAAK